jgi:guanylate kinase
MLNNTSSKGRLFVVSAPSGTGKTTLISLLLENDSTLVKTISYTSRSPREGEVDGVDYHFVSHEQFKIMISEQFFIEFAQVYGHYYGTSKKEVVDHLANGKFVVLVIDTQGAIELMKIIEKNNITFIFIEPPSIEELKKRLAGRKSEDTETMKVRLNSVEKEMLCKMYYDYVLVNENINQTFLQLKQIMVSFKNINKENNEA